MKVWCARAAVLGGAAMLGFLVQPLQHEAQAAARGAHFDWRNAEAALYCIRWASPALQHEATLSCLQNAHQMSSGGAPIIVTMLV